MRATVSDERAQVVEKFGNGAVAEVQLLLRQFGFQVAENGERPTPQVVAVFFWHASKQQDQSRRDAMDDTLRLAIADSFDENDDPARAEFIRVQVELARGVDERERRNWWHVFDGRRASLR